MNNQALSRPSFFGKVSFNVWTVVFEYLYYKETKVIGLANKYFQFNVNLFLSEKKNPEKAYRIDRYLHYIVRNQNVTQLKLLNYRIKSNWKIVTFNLNFHCKYCFETIFISPFRIMISGGTNDFYNCISNCNEIHLEFNLDDDHQKECSNNISVKEPKVLEFKSLANLLRPTYNHKQTIAADYLIYSVGGRSNYDDCIKVCQIYNIQKNIWEMGPNLIYGRAGIGVIEIRRQYIYTFFGSVSLEEVTNVIERLKIFTSDNAEWESVEIKGAENVLLSSQRFSHGIVPLPNNSCLIFGGADHSDNKLKTTIHYDFQTHTVTKGKELGSNCPLFFQRKPILTNTSLLIFDKKEDLHIYYIKQDKWEILQNHLLSPSKQKT